MCMPEMRIRTSSVSLELLSIYPLQPGSFIERSKLVYDRNKYRLTLTLPQGFAMKLGSTLCFIPILFAKYLNKIALSPMRSAFVYASAVS